jgi:uncharacterized protein YrrD
VPKSAVAYPASVELGPPISYEVLEPGTPVYSSDGQPIGKVAHVLSVPEEDVFDGVVISEHLGSEGHRFADADDIASIHEHGVVLKLDRAAAERMPEPTANPGVMRDDPAEGRSGALATKLRRAWDYISGNY